MSIRLIEIPICDGRQRVPETTLMVWGVEPAAVGWLIMFLRMVSGRMSSDRDA
jgi:hypothetical protein